MTAETRPPLRGETVLDSQDPWPGLAPFREEDQAFFHGRRDEIGQLLQLVRRRRLTVLHGFSGLGKTSLLRAGLFPKLRGEGILPVYIRLDYRVPRSSLVEQIKAAIATEAREREVEAPRREEPESLWEYFHRQDANFWDRRNEIVIPLLVLDQFEEIFTQGSTRPGDRDAFLEELGDLIEGRQPAAVKARIEAEPGIVEKFSLDRHDYKILLSLRTDFFADLADLKTEIRSIDQQRLRLQRMSDKAALDAVENAGGHLFEEGVALEAVRFVAGAQDGESPPEELGVEPALLSLLCRELNQERRRRGQPRISSDLLERDRTRILSNFYERSFQDLPPAARVLVEDRLVTETGFRDSIDLDNALRLGVDRADLAKLEDRRLLRIDDRSGRPRLELTHDVLAGVVEASRDVRREREGRVKAEAAQRAAEKDLWRSRRRVVVLAVLALVAFVGAVFGWIGQQQERKARKSEAEAKRVAQRSLIAGARALTFELIGKRQLGQGLAYLAQAIRSRPEDSFPARSLALDLLLRGTWPIPLVTARHEDEVIWAELSLDGRLLATASRDGTARVWDAATGRPLGQPLRHAKRVAFVKFSRDGRRVATASSDGTARVWDAMTGKPLTPPLRHEGPVTSAEFSPDGRLVVTASLDRTARLWDAATGQPLPIPPLRGHTDDIYWAMFDSGGGRILTASRDKTARLWDAASGRMLFIFQHRDGVQFAEFSADGRRVVTASRDKTARVWDTATGRPIGQPMQHEDWVQTARFAPDGRLVVTASLDRTARVWEADTGQELGAPMQHDDFVLFADFSPDGGRVVTACQDGTARLWDARTGAPRGEPMPHEDHVGSAQFSPDGLRVVTASEDGTARIWDVQTSSARPERLEHGEEVLSAELGPDGRFVLTRTYNQRALVWEAGSGATLGRLSGRGQLLAVRFLDDGRPAAMVESGGAVRVWDVRTDQALGPPLKHDTQILFGRLSAAGEAALTVSRDGQVRVWEIRSGEVLASWRQAGEVRAADLSPDGRRAATAEGSAVQIRDARTGREIGEPLRHQGDVASCAFSSNGRWLITFSGRKYEIVRVWDASGRAIGGPLRHPDSVRSAQIELEGGRVVTACEDGAARIWDLQTGQLLGDPMRHGGITPRDQQVHSVDLSPDGLRVVTQTGQPLGAPKRHGGMTPEEEKYVNSVDLSRDGLRVVTAGNDGTARVWDTSTAQPLSLPMYHGGAVVSARFSVDGQRVVTASEDGAARLWDVPTGTAEGAGLLADWMEVAGGYRLNDWGAAVALEDAPGRLRELRRRASETSEDPASIPALLRWFLTSEAKRPPSPLSSGPANN